KNILMSESGRSRASAHELQLIDGGYYQKRILIKQRGTLYNKNINFIHKYLIIFNVETLYGDHKNRPVSFNPLKYYLLLLAKLN
ncbi:TPA: hypothetical protein ACH4YJ_004846, partial [Escherichia coli]